MTFPGESLPITHKSGGANDSIVYRDGSLTLGGPWVLWTTESPLLLASGDDAVVSWVVEVLSGSGTISFEETLHSAVNEGTASWSSLGSHAVSGAGTLVVQSAVTSAADLLGSLIPGLRIQATSGSVEVQQVKLRVWPPGGAVGGLSGPQTSTPVGPATARITFADLAPDGSVASVEGGDVDERLAITMLTLRDQVSSGAVASYLGWQVGDGSYTQLGSANMYAEATFDDRTGGEAVGIGEARASVGYVHRPPLTASPFPSGTFGVDWIYPPNEIPWDEPYILFPLDEGDGTYQWGPNNTITLELTTPVDEPVTGPFTVTAATVEGVDPVGTPLGSVLGGSVIASHFHTVEPYEYHPFEVPEIPLGQVLRVVTYHYNHIDPTPQGLYEYDDGHISSKTIGSTTAILQAGEYDGATVTNRLNYYWQPPPYRYWTPTPTNDVVPILRVMQRASGGMGSGRPLGGRSRQNSNRVYVNP